MSDIQFALREEYLRLVDKRRYYVLGASGAALVFSMTSIQPNADNPGFLILLGSLVLLGFSGLFGFLSIEATRKFTDWNAWAVLLQDIDPKGFESAGGIQAFNNDHITPLTKRTERLDRWQLWTFFIAVALLPVWKIWSCDACIAQITHFFLGGS